MYINILAVISMVVMLILLYNSFVFTVIYLLSFISLRVFKLCMDELLIVYITNTSRGVNESNQVSNVKDNINILMSVCPDVCPLSV